MRSDDASSTPTLAKPWDGAPLAVPNYLKGQPVLSAIRVPTGRGEVDHVWMAILRDPSGRLTVCEIRFGRGWRCVDGEYDLEDYGDAYERMIARANVPAAMRRAGWRD